MPTVCPYGPVTPPQLMRARLRICWEMLSQAAEHLDVLPYDAREHVAEALSHLAQARALVEEMHVVTE